MLQRRSILTIGMALASGGVPPAQAQAWRPERRVELWVAYAPGGAADVLARAAAAHVERSRGWSVVVINRTGGAGVVMGTTLRSAPPDGHTIGLAVNAAFTFVPLTVSPPPFDQADFAYVARMARAELALVVPAERPHGVAIAEFAAHARTKPGGASVAVMDPQIAAAVRALARHVGIAIEPVAVRGGAEGLTLLLGGHVDAAILAGPQAPHVREGRLRELVALGARPTTLTPGVPTLRSLGLDLEVETVFQLQAPRGTPAVALEAHASAVRDALSDPELRTLVADRLGLAPAFSGPAETSAAMAREAEEQRRLFLAFGR